MGFKFLNENIITNNREKSDYKLMLECINESARVSVYSEMFTESGNESMLKKFIDGFKKLISKIWNYIKNLFMRLFRKSPAAKKVVSPLEDVKNISEFVTKYQESIDQLLDEFKEVDVVQAFLRKLKKSVEKLNKMDEKSDHSKISRVSFKVLNEIKDISISLITKCRSMGVINEKLTSLLVGGNIAAVNVIIKYINDDILSNPDNSQDIEYLKEIQTELGEYIKNFNDLAEMTKADFDDADDKSLDKNKRRQSLLTRIRFGIPGVKAIIERNQDLIEEFVDEERWKIETDKKLWDDEYLAKCFVYTKKNFSKIRIEHILEVVKLLKGYNG